MPITLVNNIFQVLPPWMESIRKRLIDMSTHRNVKLFLLRLILNCEQVCYLLEMFSVMPEEVTFLFVTISSIPGVCPFRQVPTG